MAKVERCKDLVGKRVRLLRDDVRALLAEVRRLRAEVAELKAERDERRDDVGPDKER